MDIKNDLVPCPYNLKLEVVDNTGFCTKFTWEGSYTNSNIKYYVSIFKLNTSFKEEELIIGDVNYSEWQLSSADGTSPEFDITKIPSSEKSGRKVLRYVFKVMAVSGKKYDPIAEDEDYISSDIVCHYGSKLPNYEVLFADVSKDGNKRQIPSQTMIPRTELTWILDGEPLSGAVGMIDETSISDTGRLIGKNISNMSQGELSDGTLNRLAKELYFNDIHLKDTVNTVSSGIDMSAWLLAKSQNRGVVSEFTIYPDTENTSGFVSKFNAYPPKILSNGGVLSFPNANTLNAVYSSYSTSETISTSIVRDFTFDLFPNPTILGKGRKYFVDINFTFNQIQDGVFRRELREFKSCVSFTFDNLAKNDVGEFTSKVVKVLNCVKSYVSPETGAEKVDTGSHQATGCRVNQYASSFNKCYAIIVPHTEVVDGVVSSSPTTVRVRAFDDNDNPSPLGLFSLNIRVIDIS